MYDSALTRNENGCFLPPSETLADDHSAITLADYIAGTHNDRLACDRICGPTAPENARYG